MARSGFAIRLAGLGLVFSVLAVGCTAPSEDLPVEVLGRWMTTEPRYADRFFEIQPEILRFGTGDNGSEVYSIRRVDTQPDPDGRLFSVIYLVDGEDMLFAFHYDTATSTIRLHNQSSIEWVKAGTP